MARYRMSSPRGARFIRRATLLIQDWSFPIALVVVWMLATAFTLVITSRQPTTAQPGTIVSPAQRPTPTVHAAASPQEAQRPS